MSIATPSIKPPVARAAAAVASLTAREHI